MSDSRKPAGNSPPTENDIRDAVYEVMQNGDVVSRADIVKRFEGRGVSRATLFRWVKAAVERLDAAAHMRQTGKTPPLPARVDVSNDDETISQGIDHGAMIQKNLDYLTEATRLALTPEGKVRNPKLLIEVVGEIRKQLTDLIRLQEKIMDQRLQLMLKAMMDLSRKQGPAFHKQFIADVKKLNISFGWGTH